MGLPGGAVPVAGRAGRVATATPSNLEAARLLPAGGTVLDVGAGGGQPAPGRDGRAAGGGGRVAGHGGVLPGRGRPRPAEGVEGRWPEVAGRVGPADVVVCHHVLYNVADLAPFAEALTGHARRRVVAELTERHPLVGLAPLWRRFHGLERPTGPGAGDAVAALAAAGLEVDRQDWEHQDRFGFDDFDELVAFTRRRLCLPAGRDPEVAEALLEQGTHQVDGVWVSGQPRRVTTLSWPGSAP